VEPTQLGPIGVASPYLWTLSTMLFLLKAQSVSGTGFCLRLQVEPTQLGPIDRASPCLITKDNKYNLTQGMLEKSKLAQHEYEEGHKIFWNEEKVLQIESNTTYRK
jgi:hypothetical protein